MHVTVNAVTYGNRDDDQGQGQHPCRYHGSVMFNSECTQNCLSDPLGERTESVTGFGREPPGQERDAKRREGREKGKEKRWKTKETKQIKPQIGNNWRREYRVPSDVNVSQKSVV